jgi:DNA-binding protein HU-beta
MTKSEFVDKVASSSGLSKKDAENAVNAVINTIETSLSRGEDVNFTGFGKFHVASRGAREGRNPRTGETMTIAASAVPRFTAGSGLKRAVRSRALAGDPDTKYKKKNKK